MVNLNTVKNESKLHSSLAFESCLIMLSTATFILKYFAGRFQKIKQLSDEQIYLHICGDHCCKSGTSCT